MQYFKRNINLFIVIILFTILCVSYVLTIPVFEAPDEPGHFLYAFYISKYNRIPSKYNESVSVNKYISENIDKDLDKEFYMNEKYMFYKMGNYINQRHHPPLYYLISSQIIKPFGVDNIDAEYNYENFNRPNRFINNKILKDRSPTIALVLILRLFQIFYGALIIIFIFKIIKLLSNNKFEKKTILLLSSIAFLPQFIFLCSYINNDLLSGLFGLVSIYFIILLFKKEKTYLGLLSILFAIIASFTKPTLLIMVPVTILTFFIWLIIKKKIWAILTFFIVALLAISAFYYILNFQRITYGRSEIEAGWVDGYKYKNVETDGDILMLEKNHAFSFDGIDDRVSVSSTPSSAVTELTVGACVYFRNFNVGESYKSTPIVSDWNTWSPGNQKGYLLSGAYSKSDDIMYWAFSVGDGTDYKVIYRGWFSPDDFNARYANKWLHITAVFKAEEYMQLYIDGELEATFDTNIPEKIIPETSTPIYFGYSGINPGYTDGIIDEVRIWNIAHTQDQIQDNMNRELTGDEEGLIGYWNFNEGKGSTVYDNTANENHGRIQVTTERSFPLLNKALRVGNELRADFEDIFYFDMSRFIETLKSSVAVFGWMNIFADKFIYYFFAAYVISGVMLFFVNIKEYRKSKKSIIFITLSIISIFTYFLLYAISTDWVQQQGRIMLTGIFLVFTLFMLGYQTIKMKYRNILYYVLFSCSLFISIFCLYNYIYLKYY